MVSVAELRRWDADAVEGVFVALGAMSTGLGRLAEPLAAARTSPELWQGVAADAARSRHDAIAARLGSLRAGVDAARFAVADAADGVADLRAQLADLEARATATGFAIGADGAVTDARAPAVSSLAERAAAGDRLVDELQQILVRADDVDATLLAAVSRATAMPAVPVSPAGSGAAMGIAPPPIDIRTPLPTPDVPDRGSSPAPVLGPLVTVPAAGGPSILGTPAPPDLGLDRVRSAEPEAEPPFPAPPEITGRTAHGEQQMQGRDGHGVSDEAVEDAVANPIAPPEFVTDRYGGYYSYQGRYAKVSLNSAGEIVTAWARNRSGWRNP